MIIFSFTNSLIKSEETKVRFFKIPHTNLTKRLNFGCFKKEYEILNDKRRLTVAITRAKEKLILIGSTANLVRFKPIASVIRALKERDNILTLTELKILDSI